MRHVLATSAVAGLAGGVLEAAPVAALVAVAGVAEAAAATGLPAAIPAVALAVIAAGAEHDVGAAEGADEEAVVLAGQARLRRSAGRRAKDRAGSARRLARRFAKARGRAPTHVPRAFVCSGGCVARRPALWTAPGLPGPGDSPWTACARARRARPPAAPRPLGQRDALPPALWTRPAALTTLTTGSTTTGSRGWWSGVLDRQRGAVSDRRQHGGRASAVRRVRA